MTSDLFIFVLLSAILHAIWNFVARRNAGNLTIFWWSLWISCVLLLPFVAGVATAQGIHEFQVMLQTGAFFILTTGIIHSFYFLLLARAYEHGEISVIYPVARGSGIGLTGFLGWLLLGESLALIGIIGICLICFGILSMGASVIRQKNFAKQGFGSALGVGATIVSYSLVDKVGVSFVHPIVYIFGMFLLSAILITPIVVLRDRGRLFHQLIETWRPIMLISVGSTGAYLMILFAMTVGEVGYIVALREFAVVIGAVLGVVFLKERITLLKVGSVLMIVFGLILIRFG